MRETEGGVGGRWGRPVEVCAAPAGMCHANLVYRSIRADVLAAALLSVTNPLPVVDISVSALRDPAPVLVRDKV